MFDNPANRANNEAANGAAPHFSAVPLMYALMSTLLGGSIAYSVAQFLSWWVALPIGVAMSYGFCTLVKGAVAPAGEVTRVWRMTCVFASLLIFCITMGFSYSTLYQKFSALNSALDYFQKTRMPVQRQLESMHANAETAAQSFKAWSQHSTLKANQEAQGGGTCPAKAQSLGRRGPIAMFREGESSIATELNVAIQDKVDSLGNSLKVVKAIKPKDYAEVVRLTSDLNAAVESAEALAHGSFVQSTKGTLQRQFDTLITWPNGEKFKCADTARDELLNRAMAALTSLEKTPSITPLAPAIDLSNPQAVASRGLLRNFNFLAKLVSNGHAGQFEDDPLMADALKKGIFNQETIWQFIASLLEFMTVIFALLAAKRGQPLYAMQPNAWLASWKAAAAAEQRTWAKASHAVGISCAKGLANLLWSYPEVIEKQSRVRPHETTGLPSEVELVSEPVYPLRELMWGLGLVPYLFLVHDCEYACIPAGRKLRASLAAQALHFRGVVDLLSTNVGLDLVEKYNPSVVMQLQRLVPDAGNIAWELYRLEPGFAQALRVHLLSTGPQQKRFEALEFVDVEEKKS